MRRGYMVMAFLLALTILFPSTAFGYSYGDPNQEDVAETLKLLSSELDNNPVDWNKVAEVYKVRRAEISSHFGASVANTLDANISSKDKQAVLGNYKAVLVMNLKRRFDYAKKGISDYAQAKLLLAKARGTFSVMETYVESKKPGASSGIYASFDAALEALGNPGLFGVGEKAADPKTFGSEIDSIYAAVKPLFPYKEAKAEPKPEVKQPAAGSGTTATKPASEPKPAPVRKPVQAVKPAPAPAAKPDAGKPAEQPAQPGEDSSGGEEAAAAGQEPQQNGEATPAEQPAESGAAPEAAPAVPAPEAKPGGDAPAAGSEPAPAVKTPAEPAAADAGEPAAQAGLQGETAAEAAHAPMARSEKTNPLVSAAVIGLVALLAGAGIWFIWKKKLL
ncbi:hypothetical protein [Paenibacillus gansuensis]|uniref:Uncharacterized protein n=1 Tax=Paenibacillus gansuensis TaxID=306542 RepID=A0ABW5PGZ4_9BACL